MDSSITEAEEFHTSGASVEEQEGQGGDGHGLPLGQDQDGPLPVAELERHGVSAADTKRLVAAGFATVQAVLHVPLKTLLKIRGINEEKAKTIMAASGKAIPIGFSSATELFGKRSEIIFITTGSEALDRILGGGLETGGITEVYGEFGTGKTQLAHTVAVTSQLPTERGGGQGKTVYISSNATFRPERILDVGRRFDLVLDDVLSNVAYARAYSCSHLKRLLVETTALMMESRYSLLIVDSLTGLYRTDYSGRGELAERQAHLGEVVRLLKRINEEFGVAILVTNQVSAVVDGCQFNVASVSPIGGHVLAHGTTTRLSMKRGGRGAKRMVKVVASPHLQEEEAAVAISRGGIADCES